MDSDEEDYVFFGTPIEREEEIASRKKKAVAEAAGQMRTLPPWKQEVTDEEGRRRFHGAFTGGYSAGYYNTVGSKEGWTPQSFTSSRKNRAEIKQQNILNFLDDDEKAEMEGRSLGTSMLFDTFGFTTAELARKQAEKEQQQRPSIIPGPAPDEIVLPATDSIGAKLLLKMGWRHGHAIRDSRANSMYDARREARKAFLAFSSDDAVAQFTGSEPVKSELESAVELPVNDDHQFPQSTLVFVCNPKQDLHGLGYDPFKHAPEFREKKRSRLHGDEQLGHRKPLSMKESLFALRSGRAAPGFGIGALEELDDEDEDVYAPGYGFEETYVQEDEEHSRPSVDIKEKWNKKEQGILPGFKMASIFDYKLERFDPPVIPKDFVPRHTFPAPLDVHRKFSDAPPPEAHPPEDNNLKVLIEGVATIVARCGKLFEDLSREKNQSNPLFSFLNGGYGHDYYLRKLWEEQQKRSDQNKPQLDGQMFVRVQKMTAESRGKILGEKPLERSSEDPSSTSVPADIHLQFNLSDTFTKPASFGESTGLGKPFRDDPEKQERFEQFLKQKYHGGLRSKDSGGASSMSEAARARERLEFEAAAEAVEKGKWGKETSKQIIEMSVATGLQFTSGGLEKESKTEEIMKNMYPKREEFQWRPSPILCKRFDIMDPYLGKPLPPPRVRSKMDSLVFMPDSVKPARAEETAAAHRDSLPLTQLGIEQVNKEEAEKELAVDVEAENVERPVDLYKAIFSDDSEGEEESLNLKQEEDPKRKIEAGNTTLNRLIAGDFLESLGKELGLEVPPELPYAENKTGTTASWKETVNTTTGNVDTPLPKTKLPSTQNAISRTSIGQEVPENNVHRRDNLVEDGSRSPELANVGWGRISGNMETVSGENKSSKVELGKAAKVDRASRTPSDRHRNSRSSTSGDERSRKRSRRRHRHRSISSDDDTADSSEHYQDRQRSRSSKNKKRSSREKSSSSSSRKQSKHRKREDSVGRPSHRGTDGERREAKREKRG